MVSRRFLHLFIAVLIALALPGLVAALAQGEASVTPIVNTLENEPNNGPWQANYGTFMNMFQGKICLLYTSPSPRDRTRSRMPSSA